MAAFGRAAVRSCDCVPECLVSSTQLPVCHLGSFSIWVGKSMGRMKVWGSKPVVQPADACAAALPAGQALLRLQGYSSGESPSHDPVAT
jgi:hypothetical protein